ncbi:MAG TPA: nucleotidyl transferase AbiEii/AbiGii toxin family protein [Candidatus Omnitrophota bacterium]|nr:nucleotidyl transferase AbiEii/AbiGii toxin family protein [Candidatus Omnitrophota bacterium]
MIVLLTKTQLSILNKRSLKYQLSVAEKDYLLAVVAKIIYGSPLAGKLVFKGGTAIHHCYLEQTRFSEDLDFTSLDPRITLEEVKSVFLGHDFLEVKKEYFSGATIKIDRLKYAGPLGLPNSLKVEIDFKQNVVLPAKSKDYRNAWGVQARVKVMDEREICAEKIRAANDRARYRDFYDLVLLVDQFKFDAAEVRKLIAAKEIRNPIKHSNVKANWQRAQRDKETELERIVYAKTVSDAMIEKMVTRLGPFLPED